MNTLQSILFSLCLLLLGYDKALLMCAQKNVAQDIQRHTIDSTYLKQADTFEQKDDYASALECYKQHLTLYPRDSVAEYYLVYALMRTKKLTETWTTCHRIIGYAPQYAKPYYILGILAQDSAHHNRAVQLL